MVISNKGASFIVNDKILVYIHHKTISVMGRKMKLKKLSAASLTLEHDVNCEISASLFINQKMGLTVKTESEYQDAQEFFIHSTRSTDETLSVICEYL
jgi:hypothetical protein